MTCVRCGHPETEHRGTVCRWAYSDCRCPGFYGFEVVEVFPYRLLILAVTGTLMACYLLWVVIR